MGAAYAADPLVFHGPFHKKTLLGFIEAVKRVAAGPSFGALPTLWLHGAGDPIVPHDTTKQAMAHLRGSAFEEKAYPGAMHEIFNETNQQEVIGDVVAYLRKVLAG